MDPENCVDKIKARGNVIVTLCKLNTKMTFFDSVTDLSVITSIGVSFTGHWRELGDMGFNMIQNGNGYLVFFTAN